MNLKKKNIYYIEIRKTVTGANNEFKKKKILYWNKEDSYCTQQKGCCGFILPLFVILAEIIAF